MGAETLDDELQALVGQPVGRGGPSVAPDPVNQPMIAIGIMTWTPSKRSIIF